MDKNKYQFTPKIPRFRAWDVRRKSMEYIDGLYWFEEQMVNRIPDSDYVIMQDVGIKDKNDKDIYEGDIVKWYHPTDGGLIYLVEYITESKLNTDIGQFGLLLINGRDFCLNHFQDDDEYEVIGNVFENPELMELWSDE